MTRAPATFSGNDSDHTAVDNAVLALARLLGEAAARETCSDAPRIEDHADARTDD